MWFALPAAVLIGVMALWPLVQLGWMSLHEVTAATLNRGWSFVGWANYAELFSDPGFWGVVRNTVAFVVVVTGLGMLGGFLVAVSVWSSTPGGSFLLGMMVFI
ncbi:MAG: hypothetical protein AAGC63_06815, partial [Propionicimonas sp.]|nr:hypothetical protein [Propionicimonas sp.]